MEEEERQMADENAKEEEKIKKQYEEVGYLLISTIIQMIWCLSLIQSSKNYWTDLTEILYEAGWYTQSL